MIKQLHFSECHSTQDLLKEQLSEASGDERLVVSCDKQISGRGRGQNNWICMPGTLCFSFNLSPHPVMSFSAIEISTILAIFFEQEGKRIKLKWPNDLWNQQQMKCGGVLIQGHQNKMMAGVGLNIFSSDPQWGGIFPSHFNLDKKELSLKIVSFIHQHRIKDAQELKSLWLERCGHLNQTVKITEGEEITEGRFEGVGEYGEAIISQNGITKKIFNGSLRLL